MKAEISAKIDWRLVVVGTFVFVTAYLFKRDMKRMKHRGKFSVSDVDSILDKAPLDARLRITTKMNLVKAGLMDNDYDT